MFVENFDNFLCEGDTISTERDGYTITARIVRDCDAHIDDDDCHNTDRSVTGCTKAQFEALMSAREAWFAGQWFYCGVVLDVSRCGYPVETCAASLWGIEANYPDTDNAYLRDVANELLTEALEFATKSRDAIIAALRD